MRIQAPGVFVLTIAGALSLSAFHPAVDTAGPLTVKMEGPGQLTRTGVPEPVAVIVENSGDAALRGTVRVQGIDRWTVHPAAAVPFSVAGKSTARIEFTVAAPEVTFNAFYP